MMSGNAKRSELLRRLAAEDFVLYEVALYLDAYPASKKALAYYEQHLALAKELRAEYERCFGPLTQSACSNKDTWHWVEGPWPWEREAN